MKRIFLLITVVTCIYACHHKIVGNYGEKKLPYTFSIRDDSTFSYKYSAFHAEEVSQGFWEKEKKYLILNSTIKNRIVPLQVLNENISNLTVTNLSIHFNGSTETKNYKCEVYINDTVCELKENFFLELSNFKNTNASKKAIAYNHFWPKYVRCDSLFSVKVNTIVKSIYFIIWKSPLNIVSTKFAPYPLETEKYLFKTGVNGTFSIDININDSLFPYKVFDNKLVKIGKKGLYFSDMKKNKGSWIPKLISEK